MNKTFVKIFLVVIFSLGAFQVYSIFRTTPEEQALIDKQEAKNKLITEQRKAQLEHKREVAKKLGCFYPGVCDDYDTKKTYVYDEASDSMIETKQSKQCSKYADSKISDLPIRCLDYFNIKK